MGSQFDSPVPTILVENADETDQHCPRSLKNIGRPLCYPEDQSWTPDFCWATTQHLEASLCSSIEKSQISPTVDAFVLPLSMQPDDENRDDTVSNSYISFSPSTPSGSLRSVRDYTSIPIGMNFPVLTTDLDDFPLSPGRSSFFKRKYPELSINYRPEGNDWATRSRHKVKRAFSKCDSLCSMAFVGTLAFVWIVVAIGLVGYYQYDAGNTRIERSLSSGVPSSLHEHTTDFSDFIILPWEHAVSDGVKGIANLLPYNTLAVQPPIPPLDYTKTNVTLGGLSMQSKGVPQAKTERVLKPNSIHAENPKRPKKVRFDQPDAVAEPASKGEALKLGPTIRLQKPSRPYSTGFEQPSGLIRNPVTQLTLKKDDLNMIRAQNPSSSNTMGVEQPSGLMGDPFTKLTPEGEGLNVGSTIHVQNLFMANSVGVEQPNGLKGNPVTELSLKVEDLKMVPTILVPNPSRPNDVGVTQLSDQVGSPVTEPTLKRDSQKVGSMIRVQNPFVENSVTTEQPSGMISHPVTGSTSKWEDTKVNPFPISEFGVRDRGVEDSYHDTAYETKDLFDEKIRNPIEKDMLPPTGHLNSEDLFANLNRKLSLTEVPVADTSEGSLSALEENNGSNQFPQSPSLPSNEQSPSKDSTQELKSSLMDTGAIVTSDESESLSFGSSSELESQNYDSSSAETPTVDSHSDVELMIVKVKTSGVWPLDVIKAESVDGDLILPSRELFDSETATAGSIKGQRIEPSLEDSFVNLMNESRSVHSDDFPSNHVTQICKHDPNCVNQPNVTYTPTNSHPNESLSTEEGNSVAEQDILVREPVEESDTVSLDPVVMNVMNISEAGFQASSSTQKPTEEPSGSIQAFENNPVHIEPLVTESGSKFTEYTSNEVTEQGPSNLDIENTV